MLKELIHDLRRYGVGTAWWNLRFTLGYRIGGFTHASRTTDELILEP